MYFAMVRSMLEYARPVWHSSLITGQNGHVTPFSPEKGSADTVSRSIRPTSVHLSNTHPLSGLGELCRSCFASMMDPSHRLQGTCRLRGELWFGQRR